MNAGSSGLPYQKKEKDEPHTKAPSAKPTSASAAATAISPAAKTTTPTHLKSPKLPTPRSATPTADSDLESAAGTLDNADIELPASALVQKVRDVDGVQLMAKRLQSSSQSIVIERLTPTSLLDSQAAGADSRPASSMLSGKALVYNVDPLRYRQLVKGLIPLRSSLMKASLDPSSADAHKKSVHFSDEDGYQLSAVRSYDLEKAVRMTHDWQAGTER